MWTFTICQDQLTYVTQRGIVGIGNNSLEVPEDLSFGEDGTVLTIQYVEPVFATSKFRDGFSAAM